MTENENAGAKRPSLREILEAMPPEERQEADRNLDEYLRVCMKLFERITKDDHEYALFLAYVEGEKLKEEGSSPLHPLPKTGENEGKTGELF